MGLGEIRLGEMGLGEMGLGEMGQNRENGAWAFTGTAQIFSVPLLSQERVKLRTSNLAGIFTGSIRTKAL